MINDILIDETIAKINFACDLKKCKGGCCTFPSDYGAPLAESEIPVIEQILGIVKKYLSDESKEIIDRKGFYEGFPGDRSTVSIRKRDCVFVYYEGDVAKCAIEKAWFDKKVNFRKPISCHLFPIRVSDFAGKYIYYQKFDECNPALERGGEENIPLYRFLKEPLERAYGAKWYSEFMEYIKELKASEFPGDGVKI